MVQVIYTFGNFFDPENSPRNTNRLPQEDGQHGNRDAGEHFLEIFLLMFKSVLER